MLAVFPGPPFSRPRLILSDLAPYSGQPGGRGVGGGVAGLYPECMEIFLPLTQLQENPSKTVGPRLLPQPPSPTCPSLKELPLQGEADSE